MREELIYFMNKIKGSLDATDIIIVTA